MASPPPAEVNIPRNLNQDQINQIIATLLEMQNHIAPEAIEFDSAEESGSEPSVFNLSVCNSETTSLSPSVYDYVYENGRRYASKRNGTESLLPNDEKEQERLDIVHHVCNLLLKGELFIAPVDLKKDNGEPARVLDIGTGTGIWAIDVGDQYPDVEVVGTDISPIQPSWVPPNVKFEIDDLESDWTFQCKFKFIHVRHLSGSVKDWQALANKCFEFLVPGGYVQFHEVDVARPYSDDGTHQGTSIQEYSNKVSEAAAKAGPRLDLAPELRQYLEKAGFCNIKSTVLKAPIGPWPKDPRYKEIGRANLIGALDGAEAYGRLLFTKILGWSDEKALKLIDATVADLKNKKLHLYYSQYYYVAQKPTGDAGSDSDSS